MIDKVLGNRYEIIEKVGGGGMAEVYKAKCRLLNRYVAVKVLRDQFKNDADVLTKFKREAQSAASLTHPNIVNVYDVGEEDGKNYIVMEYINGKTLKDLINIYGHLDNRETVNTAISIGEALEAAHKNGIVHRDIKPHNIMVTEDRIIKVTDFGIARATSSVTMTNNGGVLGSAHYLSPEQARGGMVDKRSDIYSLGVVMYEMMTGKVPFDADSPISVAIMHIQEEAVPPREINPDIPRELEFIIMKAMKKSSSERYQDIKSLLADLKSYQKDGTLASSIKAADEIDSRTQIIPPINDDMIKERNKIVKERSKEQAKKEKMKEAEALKAAKLKEKEEKRLARLEAKKKKKKDDDGTGKKTTAIAILLAFLTVIAASVIYIYSDGGIFKSEVPVPSIVGLTVDEANKLLSTDELKVDIEGEEYSEEQPEGKILRQNIPAATKIEKGKKIGVVLSQGPQPINVPSILGQDSETARLMLRDQGLILGAQTEEFNDEVEAGLIISQDPAPDTSVQKNTEVNIIISKGKEVYYSDVPNLIGLSFDQASAQLNSAQLSIGQVNYEFSSQKRGTVINQGTRAGNTVEQWSAINMTVSSGPEEKEEKDDKDDKENNNEKPGGQSTKTVNISASNITPKPVEVTVYKVKGTSRTQVYNKSGVDATSGSVSVSFSDSDKGSVVYELYVDGIPQSSTRVNF
ncbi:MAG: Stk1 family PASTA domain-containing Ser/Thr kinase [Andreesenia angusta]|nr:Stk1 family PASTA domain-containing Ser/Thr kinase [Andreesenia angusta]